MSRDHSSEISSLPAQKRCLILSTKFLTLVISQRRHYDNIYNEFTYHENTYTGDITFNDFTYN